MPDRDSNETVRWLDLGVPGLEVVIARFDDAPVERAVVLRRTGAAVVLDPASAAALADAGFRRVEHDDILLARRGASFWRSEMAGAFPFSTVRKMPVARTRASYRGYPPSEAVVSVRADHHVDARIRNKLQEVYVPASRIGTPIAMIPTNLAPSTWRALAAVEGIHGPIDAYVGRLLNVDEAGLAAILSPEQVDAVGMAMAAFHRGREFILADQTGLGKGRILAALAMAAAVMGRRVVFITEKANLFSDFWRDVMDVGGGAHLGRPFLMNDGAIIRDVSSSSGDVLFSADPTDVIRKTVRAGGLVPDRSILMATYSQFNKVGSAKGKFLSKVVRDALVIVDEGHNAAGGESNIGEVLSGALEGAWGTVRSSATFARRGVNLMAYGAVLPRSFRGRDAEELLIMGGRSLSEAMAESLAEDGVLLRREHDLSRISMEVILDDGRRDRNRAYADALAPILARMAKLARLVSDEADSRNETAPGDGQLGRKAARENWYAANFGSRLSPLLRQFLTAITVDLCVERSVATLLQGEKPVVVIESTMESLMRDLASDVGFSGEADDAVDPAEGDGDDAARSDAPPPDFRAALRIMLDRIMTLSVKRHPKADPERFPMEDPFAVSEAASIRGLIDRFPDLSLSPIDDLRDRIEAEGHRLAAAGVIAAPWRADEISARRLRVVGGRYEIMPATDRNTTIVGFNGGAIDALVITRAASTGLSLHANARVADQRRRRLIEWQIPANVVERIQFWGRVNRRGQTSIPAFEVLCSGLPMQARAMAIENRKIEEYSAVVTGSADSASIMNVPDMIDAVGNEVALRILEERPGLAERMCIAMRVDPEQAEQELYFVNKLLQRLGLLVSDEQEEVFSLLMREYDDAVSAMRATGRSPRGLRELEGVWHEVEREPYEPEDPDDGPVFGRPVDLVTMEALVECTPLDARSVADLVTAARRRLGETSGMAVGPFFEREARLIHSSRRRLLTASLSGRLVSVDSALAMNGPNPVKAADERLRGLVGILGRIQPGSSLSAPGPEGEPVLGIVVDVRRPLDDAEVHLPGRWTVRYAVPGEPRPREVSLAAMLRDPTYLLYDARAGEIPSTSLSRFDAVPAGMVTERRHFLDGNLAKAVLIAAETSAGSMVSIDDGDRRRRLVLVSRRGHGALYDRSRVVEDIGKVREILAAGGAVWTDRSRKSDGLVIRPDGAIGAYVEIPAGKVGRRFETDAVVAVCGRFRHSGVVRSVRVREALVESLVDALMRDGHALHCSPTRRPPPKRAWQGRQGSGAVRPGAAMGR